MASRKSAISPVRMALSLLRTSRLAPTQMQQSALLGCERGRANEHALAYVLVAVVVPLV
jgi:hypothetical protein